ncbi:hypothetical protein GP486_002622, partial [Trichoglossum hirsutum]
MAEQTLNIPQLIVVAIVSFVVLRWFFSSPSSNSSNASRSRTANTGRRIDPAQVEVLSQMFPQAGTREIMWDLQLNGGNPNATSERILSGRGLETVSFASIKTTANARNTQPDLITRYNLSSKLSAASREDKSNDSKGPLPLGKQAWSQNKAERAQLLQRRREEMILAARRKMEEKDR